MTIHIDHPGSDDGRWAWLLKVIFSDMLDYEYTSSAKKNCSDVKISVGEREISLPCIFLDESNELNANEKFMPSLPLKHWDIPSDLTDGLLFKTIPVLFGETNVNKKSNSYRISIDIFGTIFFMLSRFEELNGPYETSHFRYSAKSSISYIEGFIERPIVDEYVQILRNCIRKFDPSLEKVCKPSNFLITCDVDYPYESSTKNLLNLAKSLASSLIIHKSINIFVKRIKNFIYTLKGNYSYDDYWIFDWYLEQLRSYNRKGIFFFIPRSGPKGVDAAYELNEDRIISLLKKIIDSGHEIGMHASYNTFNNQDELSKDFEKLNNIVLPYQTNGIRSNRQHFLRWKIETTPDYLDEIGVDIDHSGGYHDHIGFRFGTSKIFTMWSWKKKSSLSLKQIPLLCMDVTLENYMKISLSEGINRIRDLKKSVDAFGGNFSVLWHNSNLLTATHKKLFREILKL